MENKPLITCKLRFHTNKYKKKVKLYTSEILYWPVI